MTVAAPSQQTISAGLHLGPSRRAVFAFHTIFAVVPLTFLAGEVAGVQPSGYAWLLIAYAVAPVVVTEPLDRDAARLLLPYAAALVVAAASLAAVDELFRGVRTLLQYLVPALCYLLAWRVPETPARQAAVGRYGRIAVAVAVVLVAATTLGVGIDVALRPMAVTLALVAVVGVWGDPTPGRVVVVGGAALAIALATGSRTASVVLAAVLLAHPSLRLRRRQRVAIGVAVLLGLAALVQTSAFQERFFYDGEGSLRDVVTLSADLNTAGRRDLWPQLAQTCSRTPWFGQGVGVSYALSEHFGDETLVHPHNDYLRTFCDTGLVGSVLFWGFFCAAGVRAVRTYRRSGDLVSGSAAALVAGLLLYALTDNPVVYTAQLMAPLAFLVGWADRRAVRASPAGRGGGGAATIGAMPSGGTGHADAPPSGPSRGRT